MKLQGETPVHPVSPALNKNIQHAWGIYIFFWRGGGELLSAATVKCSTLLHQQITFVRLLRSQTWWVWGFYHSAELMEDGKSKVILIISICRLGVTYTRLSLGGQCLVYKSPGLFQRQSKGRYAHTCSRPPEKCLTFIFQISFSGWGGCCHRAERQEFYKVRRRQQKCRWLSNHSKG